MLGSFYLNGMIIVSHFKINFWPFVPINDQINHKKETTAYILRNNNNLLTQRKLDDTDNIHKESNIA